MLLTAASQLPSTASDEAAPSAIAERVRARQLQRVQVLERAVLALMDGTLDDTLREAAESEAHALAGTMPTFGLRQGMRVARALEQSFAARYTLERSVATRLADQVLALRTELERPLVVPSTPEELARRPRLVLCSDVASQRDQYVTEGLANGLDVRPLAFTVDVDLVRNLAPRALILELAGGDRLPSQLDAVRRLARAGAPLLVIGDELPLADRVLLARCGAVGPLPRPIAPADVLQHALRLADARRVQPGTVLVVDTDPYAGQTARLALERAGHLVYTLFEPERLWETLETVQPELLLVGARLGRHSGVDVGLATRADPRWRDLPVILAASGHDEAIVREAYCDGIDDVVRKPLDPRLLTARVSNRLRLSRQLRRRDETEPVTGLPSRSKGEREVERLLRLVRRHAQRFSLLTLRLDRHDRLRTRHGQAMVDAAMRRLAQLAREAFRVEDVIAHWGAGELVIGLFDADANVARDRARDLMATFTATTVPGSDGPAIRLTCSVGIASVPDVPADLGLLHAAAESALLLAGVSGSDEVLAVASQAEASQHDRVDVLLVDDDPATAALLTHALAGRHWSVRWMRDGAEAAAALAGERPAVTARVLVLDVNLPSLDGLSVLRAIAAAHALRRTRVLMLSQRTSDAETLQAFELGAFDYVAKPFSVNVLLERIRRALVT
jgi:diguanylate cyclase (GGDEF)-like protein